MPFICDPIWDQIGYVPFDPTIDFTGIEQFLQPPLYTDDEWARFYPPFCSPVEWEMEAFTNPEVYTYESAPVVGVSQAPPTRMMSPTADILPAQATSPGTPCVPSNVSRAIESSSGGSPFVSTGHSARGRRRHRHSPYSLSQRPKPTTARSTTNEAFSCILLSNTSRRSRRDYAVYTDSPAYEIQDELDYLSQLFRSQKLLGETYHPYTLCPVFDCPRGGYNPLLHGDATPDCIPTSNTQQDPFFKFNELRRHVNTKHLPDHSLRCGFAGCIDQLKLDQKAGAEGKGRFSRPDLLRRHLKKCKGHRESVSEELRVKYKLWKD